MSKKDKKTLSDISGRAAAAAAAVTVTALFSVVFTVTFCNWISLELTVSSILTILLFSADFFNGFSILFSSLLKLFDSFFFSEIPSLALSGRKMISLLSFLFPPVLTTGTLALSNFLLFDLYLFSFSFSIISMLFNCDFGTKLLPPDDLYFGVQLFVVPEGADELPGNIKK